MDSFEQNATVKVHEMEAMYQVLCLKLNEKQNHIDSLLYQLNRIEVNLFELKQSINSLSLWEFVKRKIKRKDIC